MQKHAKAIRTEASYSSLSAHEILAIGRLREFQSDVQNQGVEVETALKALLGMCDAGTATKDKIKNFRTSLETMGLFRDKQPPDVRSLGDDVEEYPPETNNHVQKLV